MTAILKPSTDFLTSNKLLKVTHAHNYSAIARQRAVTKERKCELCNRKVAMPSFDALLFFTPENNWHRPYMIPKMHILCSASDNLQKSTQGRHSKGKISKSVQLVQRLAVAISPAGFYLLQLSSFSCLVDCFRLGFCLSFVVTKFDDKTDINKSDCNLNFDHIFSYNSSMVFVLQHSWYFFEALVKSMAHYLMESGKVKVGLVLVFSSFL